MAKSFLQYKAEQRKKEKKGQTTQNSTAVSNGSTSSGTEKYREDQRKSPLASNYGYSVGGKGGGVETRPFSEDATYVASKKAQTKQRKNMSFLQWKQSERMKEGYKVGDPVGLEGLARQVVDDSIKRRNQKALKEFRGEASEALGLSGKPITTKALDDAIHKNNRMYWLQKGASYNNGITKTIGQERRQLAENIRNTPAWKAEERRKAKEEQERQDSLRRMSGREGNIIPAKRERTEAAEREPVELKDLIDTRRLNDRKDGAVAIQKRQPNLNGYVPEDNTYEQISQDPDFNLYKLKGKTSFYDPDYQAGIERLLIGTSPVDYMTQEQKDTYNYIYGKYGKDAVKEYESSILPELNRLMQEDISKRVYEESKSNPLKGLGMDLGYSFWAPYGTFQSAVNVLTGQPIDPNNISFLGTNAQSAAHQGIMDKTKETFGDNALTDFVGEGVLGMAENAARYPLGAAGLTFMGMQAASSSIKEAKERGATDTQAMALGLTTGLVEYLTEQFSLGELEKVTQFTENPIRTAKDFAIAVATNFGVEASEEMASEVLDTAADMMIMQGNSEVAQRYNNYLQQGMTEEQAKLATFGDFMKDVARSGIIGGITGAGMGGTTGVYNLAMNQANANNISNIMTQDYARQGMMPAETPIQMLENLAEETEQAQQGPSISEINKWASSKREDPKNLEYEYLREVGNSLEDSFEGEAGKEAFRKIPMTERPKAYRAFMAYYNHGYRNTKLSESTVKAAGKVLNLQQISDALNAGAMDAQKNYPTREIAHVEETTKNIQIPDTAEGSITYDKDQYRNWTSQQKLRVHYAGSLIAKAFGIDVEFFESVVGEDGKFYDPETYYNPDVENELARNGGFYINPKTGRPTIMLDINAGMGKSSDWTGDISDIKTLFPIIAHEMTHYLEKAAPEHYKALSDTVTNALIQNKHYTKGLTLNQMIQKQRIKMEEREKRPCTNDDALREIVARACEDMLNGNEDAINAFNGMNKKTQRYVWNHIKKIFDNIQDFFRQMLNSYRSNSAEAQVIRQNMKDFEEIRAKWQEALGFAMSEGRNVEFTNPVNAETETGTADTFKNGVSKDGVTTGGTNGAQFSERTYENGGRDYLKLWLETQSDLNDDDRKDVVDQIDKVYNMMQELKRENKLDGYTAWSHVENRDGKLTVIVPNGEYPLNVDFSTVCKKRKALDHILNTMIRTEQLSAAELAGKDIVRLQNIIKSEGLEIACALCFVDSKRYRIGDWAERITAGKDTGKSHQYGFNELLDSLIPEGSNIKIDEHNFTGREIKQPKGKLLKNVPDSELDFELVDSLIKNSNKSSWNYKVATAIRENPDIRSYLNSVELLSSIGFDPIKAQSPALFNLINNAGGSSKPKLSFSEVPYLNDILLNQQMTPEQAYKVGGVRIQSFSDFMANMVFDYVQMVGELQAKKLPAHAYTKEASFVAIFGKTGIKINMSLVPKATTMTKEELNDYLKQFKTSKEKKKAFKKLRQTAGLDADGNYIWEDETFPYEVAMHFQADPEYAKNCGTIAVGISDAHIRKLLADPTIQMVIPYHISGINNTVAKLRGIDLYVDYTKQQTTKNRATGKSITASQDTFDFYKVLKETGDPKATAQAYLDWCKENNFIPKFEKFTKGPGSENYYKLLIDFRVYDENGNYAPQQAVQAVYPEKSLMKEYILNGYKYKTEDGREFQNGGLNAAESTSNLLDEKTERIIQRYNAGETGNEGAEVKMQNSSRDSDGNMVSEAQEDYFKDSQVRDADGNLIPVYHGTNAEFNEFSKDFIGSHGSFEGAGFNFTPSRTRAGGYKNIGENAGKVMEGYLNITKPLSDSKKTMSARNLANLIRSIDPTGDNIISNYARDTRDYGKQSFITRESLTTARAIFDFADSDVDIYSELSAAGADPKTIIEAFEKLGYDGLIHHADNGDIKTLIAFESNQFKNRDNLAPTKNPDIRYASRDEGQQNTNKIIRGMSPEKRYEILKDKTIRMSAKADRSKMTKEIESEIKAAGNARGRVRQLFTKLSTEFGVKKSYYNKDIELEFTYSGNNVRESVAKQKERYEDLALLFTCLDDVIENAIGIEVHNLNEKGYKVNKALKEVYVLVSAFEDGDRIVPVKLEVKELEGVDNTLYVAIALNSIKKSDIVALRDADNSVAYNAPSLFSNISLAQLLSKINKDDIDFVKYIPTQFRTDKEGERKHSASNPEHEVDTNTIQAIDEGKIQYSERITDRNLIEQLEEEIANGDYITTYKAMQLIDGKLYPPMAAKVKGEDGKYRLTNPSELGIWQQAVEDPSHIKIKNGKGYYTLNKGNGKSIDAAYNPYEHSSNLVLNDQFEEAYNRTNIVTVECVIPKSEIDNPYQAEYAKDATGVLDWKAGTVAGKLKNNRRMVYLSRYLKPVRILNESEVAKMWKETLGDSGILVPFNVVTPQLREALEAEGVKIDYEGSPTYRSRNKTQYSSRDSDGNELTEGQQEYFANSKVRDRKGNLVKLYHGGTVENVFDTGRGAGGDTEFGPGAYFTDSEYYAKEYTEYRGGKVKEYYINLTNPYDNRKKFEDGPEWDKVKGILTERYGINDKDLRLIKNWGMKTMQEVIDRYTGTKQRGFFTNVNEANAILREAGYDGVIAEYNDVLQYVVFNPNQAKLTTNQNPTENVDIRYASRDVDAFDLWQEVVAERNDEEGRDSVFFMDDDDPTKVTYQQQEFMEELSKNSDTVMAMNAALHQAIGEGKQVDVAKFAAEQARKLRTEYGSKIKKADLQDAIESLCKKMNKAVQKDANDIAIAASNIGREVMDGVMYVDDTMKQMYPNLQREIKSYRLAPSSTARGDMAAAYDSYESFRRRAFGRLTLVNEESSNFIRVDSAYQELSEKYPDLFPADTINESEQLLRILEVANDLSGVRVKGVEALGMAGSEIDAQAYMIGQDILGDFYRAAGQPAFGGVLETVRDDLKTRYHEEIRELRYRKNAKIAELQSRIAELEADNDELLAKEREKLHTEKIEALIRQQQRNQEEIEKLRKEMLGEKNKALSSRQLIYNRLLTKMEQKKLNREARARLLSQARILARMKGGPDFEARKAELIGQLDLISTGMRSDTRAKLEEFRTRAQKLAAEDENYAGLSYKAAEAVFSRLSKKHISNMTGKDIADLTEKIVELIHMEQDSKRMLNKEIGIQVSTVAKTGMDQQKRAKGINERNALGAAIGKYTLNMLNPTRAMAMLDGYAPDGVLKKLGDALNDGQTKMNDFIMKSNKKFDGFLEKHRELADTWYVNNIDTGLKDKDGKPIYINKGMRISLYLHSLNNQNMNHIAGAGISIPDAEMYRKGKYSIAYRYSQNVRLMPTDIKEITSHMTEDEKAFAELARTFLNKDTKDAINETSMVLNGTLKAGVDNYFPIRTDTDFVMRDVTGLIQDATIEGMGMLKERVMGAKTPILLEDVAVVIQRQTQNTARYYGLAIPVRDFNKIFKWKKSAYVNDYKEDGTKKTVYEKLGENPQLGAEPEGFRKSIRRTWGDPGIKYIEGVLKDIQTGGHGEEGPGARMFSSLKSTYAGTVLNWNLGVSIKQSASAPFAAVVLDAKSVAKAFAGTNFFKPADLEYMDSITPWSYMRRKGMSGTEMGEVYKQKGMIQKSGAIQWLKSHTNFIQAVDVWTTNRLFKATEYYVQDHFPKLEKRGPEYNQKVAELYNDMLQRTQPSYDVMQRNAFLRSDSPATKVFGMFKTQTFNMGAEVIDAWGRLTAYNKMHKDKLVSDDQLKQVRGQFGKTVGATIVSQLMLTALGVLAKAVYHNMKNYRDDEGRVTPESIIGRAIYEFLTSFFGMTMGGAEVQSIVLAVTGAEKWYDLEYPGLSSINDMITNATKMTEAYSKAAENEWEPDKAEAFKKSCIEFGMSAAVLGRIPADNLYKIGNALYLHVQDFKAGKFGSFESGDSLFGLRNSNVTDEQYANRANAEYESGDIAAGDEALETVKDSTVKKVLGEEADLDEDGEKIQGSAKRKTIDELIKSDRTDEKKGELFERMYQSDTLDAWKEDGGTPYDFMMGLKLDQLAAGYEEGEKKYAYVVDAKDFTNQQKIAWFRSSVKRCTSEAYTAWRDAGYTEWDYIKYRGDLEHFKGLDKKEKRDKTVNYIKKNTSDQKKRRMLWEMAGYKESSYDKYMK